jgi:hypothetical protein
MGDEVRNGFRSHEIEGECPEALLILIPIIAREYTAS